MPLEGPPNDFFAFGKTELVGKLFKGITDKAKEEAARLKPSSCYDPKFPQLLRAVGLIKLTIASGKELSVGGRYRRRPPGQRWQHLLAGAQVELQCRLSKEPQSSE